MIYMLRLQVIDCVAFMCTHFALKNGPTVWFMPTDIKISQLHGDVNEVEECTTEPKSVYVPVIDDKFQHCFLVIIETNSWTVEVYDTVPLQARFKYRTQLALNKVCFVLFIYNLFIIIFGYFSKEKVR